MGAIENPKQQQIVSTARSLFWKFGIRRVSIEEICREANVSKMTFYKYFNNKVTLVKFILDEITAESMVKYQQIMNQNVSFAEKVKQSIQLKIEQTNDLTQEFFADIHKNADPEIRKYFNKKAQESIQVIRNDYVKAQQQGHVRPDIKPEFILYFLNHLFEMARDEKLIKFYDSPQDLILELTNFFFFGILPWNNRKQESKDD